MLTLTPSGVLKSGSRYLWDAVAISPEQVKDGTILMLEFDTLKSAKKGSHEIRVSYTSGDIIDNDLNALSLGIYNGKIVLK